MENGGQESSVVGGGEGEIKGNFPWEIRRQSMAV